MKKKRNMKVEQAKKEDQMENGLPADSILKTLGDLTIFEASQFHDDLKILHQQEGPLELDLSEVDRMDSSCVQLIVAATPFWSADVEGVFPPNTRSIRANWLCTVSPIHPECVLEMPKGNSHS